MSGPKVDIYVGLESIHYRLPKDILCHYSLYFDRCFNGHFKEAIEQELTLREDLPEFFDLLLDYMFIHVGNIDNIQKGKFYDVESLSEVY